MKELEPSISRYVDFPDLGENPIGRNQPLIVNVEPRDLTNFLSSNGSVQVPLSETKEKVVAYGIGLDVNILLLHSDCRAPILYVDYTQ
jgi:hypothetical protein